MHNDSISCSFTVKTVWNSFELITVRYKSIIFINDYTLQEHHAIAEVGSWWPLREAQVRS
jgi:hypothetical protein